MSTESDIRTIWARLQAIERAVAPIIATPNHDILTKLLRADAPAGAALLSQRGSTDGPAPTFDWQQLTATDSQHDINYVGGPSGKGSTDEAVMRWDGTDGNAAQDSSVSIDDSGNMTLPGNITVSGLVDGRNVSTMRNYAGASVPFITNVTGGNVNLTYVSDTSPSNKVVATSSSDQNDITVYIEVDGGVEGWQPSVDINGTAVTNLSRMGSYSRRFSGSAAITMSASGDITVTCDDGSTYTIAHTRASGPEITAASFGSYPGSQTAVKSGDSIHITGTCDTDTAEIFVKNAGASSSLQNFPGDYSGGTFDITITVGNASGSQTCTLYAEDASNNAGGDYETDNSITLDQTYPTIPDPSVSYPASQAALKDSETADATSTITNAGASPTYLYSCTQGTELSPANASTYEATKTWTRTGGTYRDDDDADNARITVTRAENAATTTRNFLIEIANTTPTVKVASNTDYEGAGQALGRLGSDDGTNNYRDHYVYLNSNQKILSAPDATNGLVAPLGTWQGSWSKQNDHSYRRQLRIADGDILQGGQAANNYSWTSCEVINRAGKTATSVTTNPDYSVGGFQDRTLTIPAWTNREADIGVYVVDTSNLTCENLSKGGGGPNGGTVFTFDNSPGEGSTPDDETDKFCITNGSDVVDDDGQYWFNKDLSNAQSNLTGTAQVIIGEDP